MQAPIILRRQTLALAGAAVVLTFGASVASADQLLLLTSGATVQGVVDRRDNITTNSEPVLTRTATFAFFYSYPAVPANFQEGSFEAFGEAKYGSLDLGLSTDYAGNAEGALATVFSSGLWQDGLTFVAPSSGHVQFEYRLVGSSTSTSDSPVQSQAIVRFYGGVAGPPPSLTISRQTTVSEWYTKALLFPSRQVCPSKSWGRWEPI